MNMKQIGKTVTLAILILSIFAGCAGYGKIVTEPMPSEETNAETSYTEETKTTETISTAPSETEPPVTEPPVTEPAETEPIITEPSVTEPPVTEPPHVHSYTAALQEATCTEAGYTTYTCTCGDSYQRDHVNAKGHTYVDTVIAPTTTQQGYTEHACACGYSYIDSYVPPVEEVFPFTDAELAAEVIKFINQRRKEDGAPELIPQPIMGEIAKIRSEQLLTDYKHDTLALRKICAEFQYGRYVNMTQYGYDSSYNYYDARLAEAIGCFAAVNRPVDEAAQRIALAFRNSSAHWSYLGDTKMKYIAVGCSKDRYDWYVCIFVSEVTYG